MHLSLAGRQLGRRAWAKVEWHDLDRSWAQQLPALVLALTALQERAAGQAGDYVDAALTTQGVNDPASATPAPGAFSGIAYPAISGTAAYGVPLGDALGRPTILAKTAIAQGAGQDLAMRAGLATIDRVTSTVVTDAGRQAVGASIAARRHVGYVRMLTPPSCDRCAILAGRWYRWNAGFQRHPHCDCVGVPAEESASELRTDPYKYFESLTKSEQNRIFTKAGARAIREDDADIFQVVNAHNSVSREGISKTYTTLDGRHATMVGTSRRGYASHAMLGRTLERGEVLQEARLLPDAIYQIAGDDRARAQELLRHYGYVTGSGQIPTGAIRGH